MLRLIISTGIISPCRSVLDDLTEAGGCGLLDRLIVGEYRRAGLTTLTLDKKMAALADSRLL
jgi:hypothetical protein